MNPDLDPLSESPQRLAYVSYDVVKPLIGAPFGVSEEEFINSYDSRLAAPPQLLFLGIDESDKESGFVFVNGEDHASRYEGRPYFAVEVGEWRPEGVQGEWRKTRFNLKLVREDAAIFAQARSIMDWNIRNRVWAPGAAGGKKVLMGGRSSAPRVEAPRLVSTRARSVCVRRMTRRCKRKGRRRWRSARRV
jgi:NAD+ diphosphatase